MGGGRGERCWGTRNTAVVFCNLCGGRGNRHAGVDLPSKGKMSALCSHLWEGEAWHVGEQVQREAPPRDCLSYHTHHIQMHMARASTFGAFRTRPEHKRHGASSASSHICLASPRDLRFTSGVSLSQMGLGLSQRPVGAWGWGPWHEGPAGCRWTPPSAMPHLKNALAKLFNQFLKLGNF